MNRTNKKVHQKIELTFSLRKKSLYKLFGRKKKINPEIWSQKYPLGRWSWRPLLKKSSYQIDFENSREILQLVENIKPTRIFSAFITIVIYTHIYLKYIPYYYQDIWTKKWHTIHKTKKKSPPTTDHQNVKLETIFQKIILAVWFWK